MRKARGVRREVLFLTLYSLRFTLYDLLLTLYSLRLFFKVITVLKNLPFFRKPLKILGKVLIY